MNFKHLVLSSLVLCLTAPVALATNVSLNSGNWFTDTNWDGPNGVGNATPQAGDGDAFAVIGSHTLAIAAGNASTDGSLFIGIQGNGRLDVTGGNLDNSKGAISLGSVFAGQDDPSSGTLNVSGNASVSSTDLDIGETEGKTGTVNVSGGIVNTSDDLDVGQFGTGTLSFTGGTINVTDLFAVARGGTSTGTFTMSGGTLNALADISMGTFGDATANISGGIINVADDFTVAQNGTANVDVSGNAQIDIGDELRFGLNSNSTGHMTVRENAIVNVSDDIFMGRNALSDSGVTASLTIQDNAQVNVTDDVSHGNLSESQTAIIVSDNAVLSIGGAFRVGGTFADGAQTTLTQTGGTITSLFLTLGTLADGAQATVNLSDGLMEGTGSVRILAGSPDGSGVPKPTTVTISGGELKSGSDMDFAGFDDAEDLNINQTGGKVTVDVDFFFVGSDNSETTYNFSAGEISIGGDAVFGSDFSTGEIGDFNQSGGTMTVAGNLENTGEVVHTISGGTLEATTIRVGLLGTFGDPDSTGVFNVAGGTVTAQADLVVENGQTTITDGAVSVAGNAEIGNLTDSDSTVAISSGTVHVAGDVVLGTITQDQAAANLNQSGGTLLVGGDFINDQGGNHTFTGGILSSQNAGPINYFGDFEMTNDAILKLDDDKTLVVSGSFDAVDTTPAGDFAGAGVLDVDGTVLDLTPGTSGAILLAEILGDTSNLIPSGILDEVALLSLDFGTATRISEFDFENGNLIGAFWALVEGAGLGGIDGDGQVGIAFSNFAIPEPNALLLVVMAGLGGRVRRRRAIDG